MRFSIQHFSVLALTLVVCTSVLAGGNDDPLLTKVMIDQLEVRGGDSPNPVVLDGQAWIGHDLNKLWIKADASHVDGNTEEAEVQALYSKAVAPFWDLQVGARRDIKPSPSRNWLVLGAQGLAPYFFDVETAFFVGESGRTALRFKADYEMLFTQHLILTPEMTVNLYGKNDPETATGAGLSDSEIGLRLRYEIRREIAPYIGVNWTRKYGNSADFARADGEHTGEARWVAGFRFWF